MNDPTLSGGWNLHVPWPEDGESWKIYLNSQSSDKALVPGWWVRTTHDFGESNMKIDGDLSKQTITLSSNVKVPCIVNHKSLAAGDELLLYREKPNVPAQCEVLQDIKRRKTSKASAP